MPFTEICQDSIIFRNLRLLMPFSRVDTMDEYAAHGYSFHRVSIDITVSFSNFFLAANASTDSLGTYLRKEYESDLRPTSTASRTYVSFFEA